MNFQAYGGRRFLMTMGCGVVNTILFASGTLTEGGYLTIILSTVAAYITADTTQKVMGK